MIGNASFHRWCHAQGLMNPAEIVAHVTVMLTLAFQVRRVVIDLSIAKKNVILSSSIS
jgi:hypothetical protein